jgi:hypothetical protein
MNLTCVRRTAYGVAAVVLAAVGQDQTVYAQVAETRASVEVTTVTDTLPGAVGGLTVDRLGYGPSVVSPLIDSATSTWPTLANGSGKSLRLAR